jgi:hypothetical protein
MSTPIRILLQTTIPYDEDNWHIGRFSLLQDQLSSVKTKAAEPLFHLTTRDRQENEAGDDEVLSHLDESDFDELWLFAVDLGDGLSGNDCHGITRFRQRGGGIMATRDHQDLGISLCTLGGVGRAHFFHSKQMEPDPSRHVPDDKDNHDLSWPNYHSGSNGNYQRVSVVQPVHELMRSNNNLSGVIEWFPAHPHEGAVGIPEGQTSTRIIATSISQATNRSFNLAVAFENSTDRHGNRLGRAVAESSFHHFVDYNWDTSMGCPSFLTEPPGDEIQRDPQRLEDVKTYVRNVATWLAGQ